MQRSHPIIWVLAALTLAVLLLAGDAPARYRLSDNPLFLQELGAGKVDFDMQGKQFSIQADTSRLESSLSLRYGLSEKLSFEFNYPFLMESQGAFSKSGQGDLMTALTFHQPLKSLPGLAWGLRQALVFPSGFRRELDGFESFTLGRTQSETLAQLELGDRPGEAARLWLSLNGGLRTDNHRQHTRALWGAAMRYHLLHRWFYLESELAQEMATGSKEASYQFSAGLGAKLPLGFRLRLGAEERVLYDLDRFGLYLGFSWSRQPTLPVRVRHRHLREGLQQRLNEKNKVPSFTLEPGTPELLSETGRLPFLPLRVAVLPFEEGGSAPVADELTRSFQQAIEADSSFQVIAAEEVRRVLEIQHLAAGQLADEGAANLVGRELRVDLVLRGRVQRFEPSLLQGPLFAPFMANTRSGSLLDARVWLQEVDSPSPPQQASLQAQRFGKSRLSWFPVTHGHRELPRSAVERSQLTRQVLDSWCAQARETLLYEVSEQLVVE